MLIGMNINAYAQDNDIKLGGALVLSSGALGFDEIDNNIGLRAEVLYPVNEKIRLVGDFTFFFPKESGNVQATVLGVNFNGHYQLYSEDKLNVYGLGGINIAILSIDFPNQDGNDLGGLDDSTSEFGLNLGAGAEYALDFGNLFGELKFAGVGGNADQLVFGLGVRFNI